MYLECSGRGTVLHKHFPQFAPGDVRVAIIGERGLDIKLSPFAKKVLPYDFECKNQERNRTIYNFYNQAKKYGNKTLTVCKIN